MDAAEMARLMVLDDTILPADRMNTQQIRSYIGKLCEMEKKGELQISRALRYTFPGGENGENQMECEAESEWLDEDVENIYDVGREQDDVVRDLVLKNLGSIFSQEDPAFAVDS